MREPLPMVGGHDYNRPQQPWICGRTDCGDPCVFGPGRGGSCPDLPECTPRAVGGVFECTRPAVRGGPCDEGPRPDGKCCRHHKCRPVRNLRSVRGVISRSLLLLVIGGAFLVLGSSWRSQLIAPGPLCQSHAQILRGLSSEQRCQACHTAGETSPTGWLGLAMAGESVGPTQSQRCMACHETLIDSSHALDPHNLPPAQLLALRNSPDAAPHENAKFDQVACSVCHQEHHGPHHNLSAMDNTRCQACHQQQFASFADGHPEFGIWPYERRTPIAFNHASHAGKHFGTKGETFDCASCHRADSSGNYQLTLSFEQSCARCHEGAMQTSFAQGIPVFTLPMIDVDALREAGHDVGEWPAGATGDFDGVIPAPLRLVLARDSEWSAITKVLGSDFELGDIDPDDPQHLEAAARLVRLLKRQWWQMQNSWGELSPSSLGVSRDLLASAQAAWLPSLEAEMSTSERQVATPPVQSQSPAPAGPFTRDDTTLSLVYHPTGHADPVLKRWLEQAAAEPDSATRKVVLAELASPAAPGLCASCHSIEQQGRGASPQLTVQWHPYDRSTAPRSFTKFSHRPHLTQVELRDCTTCHALEPGAATAAYTGHNPHVFVSDFQPVSLGTCTSCHQRGAAASACTTCHNYHVSPQ